MGRPVTAAAATFRLLLRAAVVAAGAATTTPAMAAQTVKHAATQAELIAALGNDTTIVLNNTILLESSTDPGADSYGNDLGATGIVIENVKGLVIDGAGFAIDGQGKMRCLYVGENSDVALIDTTVTNGYADFDVSKASESKIQANCFLSFFLSVDDDVTNHSPPLTQSLAPFPPSSLLPPPSFSLLHHPLLFFCPVLRWNSR